jgi:hypothetical protein
MAGDGEGVRHHADHVGGQDEHEQREHEGKERPAGFAQDVAHHVGDELVGDLTHRLKPGRHELGRSRQQQHHHDAGGNQHPQAGIGEGSVDGAEMDRHQGKDLELVHGVEGDRGTAGFVHVDWCRLIDRHPVPPLVEPLSLRRP